MTKTDFKIFLLCLKNGKKKIEFPKTKISFGFDFFQMGSYEIICFYLVFINIKIYTEITDN